jgi:hypothetical protein
MIPLRGGTSIFYQKSDGQGRFVIRDVKGKHLYIETSKEGYYDGSESYRGFQYAGVGGNFSPDPNHPEIFRLHKMGERVPLISARGRMEVPTDGGTVTVSLYTLRTTRAVDSEALSFRAERVKDNDRSSFQFVVEVPQGGVFETRKELDFIAPESGYEKRIVLHPKNIEERTIFVRFNSGNYARVSVNLVPGNPGIRLCSVFNPDGSRNLEADPDRWISVRTHLNGSISLIYPKGYEPKTP